MLIFGIVVLMLMALGLYSVLLLALFAGGAYDKGVHDERERQLEATDARSH